MIPEIDPVNNWAGNGSTTRFNFDYLINSEEELTVILTKSNSTQIVLVLGVDYSINEIKNPNGSYITFPLSSSSYPKLASDEKISLALNLAFSQESVFSSSGVLNLPVLEQTFDYVTRLIQIIKRQVDRSIKVQEGSAKTPDEFLEALDASVQSAASSATLAQAATGVVPIASGNGSSFLRQKTTENGLEYRTPAQVLLDIGVGALASLATKVKTNIVDAINSVFDRDYSVNTDDMPQISQNAIRPYDTIDVSTGFHFDHVTKQRIDITSVTSKNVVQNFAEGGGNGTLDTGSISYNTSYNVFVIAKDDGTTDILTSLSLSSPVMPSGFTHKYYIGDILIRRKRWQELRLLRTARQLLLGLIHNSAPYTLVVRLL